MFGSVHTLEKASNLDTGNAESAIEYPSFAAPTAAVPTSFAPCWGNCARTELAGKITAQRKMASARAVR